MSTEDLIHLLARRAGPAGPAQDSRRLALGLPLALPLMLAASGLVLGFVPPELWPASSTALKLAYGFALAGAAVWLLRRLGRPASSLRWPVLALAAVLAAAAVAGGADILRLPTEAWPMQAMGKSALRCPLAISVLALPALAVAMACARALAPTDLRLAGLAAGLFAGGLGAAAYALACDEGAVAFIALWYTAGMLLSGLVGMTLGPRVLRW